MVLAIIDKDYRFFSLILISDKYNLEDLGTLCEEALEKSLTLDNVFNIMDVAFKLNDAKNLRTACVEFATNNLGRLIKTPDWKKILTSKPEVLEAVLLERCKE